MFAAPATVWSILMTNHYIILGLSDGTIETYRLKENKLFKTGSLETNKSGICHLLTTPSGVIAINLFAEIYFLDFHADTLAIQHYIKSGHTHAITCVKLLANQLVTGSTDETIRVISIEKGRIVHVLKGHLFPITALGLCKNGKGQSDAKVMSADESGEIRLWTLTSGRCQFILREKFENDIDSIRLTQRTGFCISRCSL